MEANRANPEREHRVRLFSYVVGVPLIAFLYYSVFLSLLGKAFAGAEAYESVPFLLRAAVAVLEFPFVYLLAIDPLVDALKHLLTDNQILFLFTALNGVFWGFALVSVGLLIYRRTGKLTQPDAAANGRGGHR